MLKCFTTALNFLGMIFEDMILCLLNLVCPSLCYQFATIGYESDFPELQKCLFVSHIVLKKFLEEDRMLLKHLIYIVK